MGNNQSNTRKTDYRAYKIVGVDENEDFTRCHLHEYVPYENGDRKHMDFERESTAESVLGLMSILSGNNTQYNAVLARGLYIVIDIEMTRNYSSTRNFSKRSVWNTNVAENEGESFISAAGGLLEEIQASRERYHASIEDARASNYARLRQTSYDLPPRK